MPAAPVATLDAGVEFEIEEEEAEKGRGRVDEEEFLEEAEEELAVVEVGVCLEDLPAAARTSGVGDSSIQYETSG